MLPNQVLIHNVSVLEGRVSILKDGICYCILVITTGNRHQFPQGAVYLIFTTDVLSDGTQAIRICAPLRLLSPYYLVFQANQSRE